MIFPFSKKIEFWGILGPPYYGIDATIRIGREMLCLPYAGFFIYVLSNASVKSHLFLEGGYMESEKCSETHLESIIE